MAVYALVNDSDGLITNRIVLDDPGAWEVPAGATIAEETDTPYEIGGTLIDGSYTPPPSAPVEPAGPGSPSPEDVVLYGHENRLRALEGQPPLDLGDFLVKIGRR